MSSPRLWSFSQRHDVDETPELRRSRAFACQKLESRLMRIYEKYNRPFDGVSDEIDMQSGEVVVDNGHLEHMQHGGDTGTRPVDSFVRAFTQELGDDDGWESESLDDSRASIQTAGQSAVRSPASKISHDHRHGRQKSISSSRSSPRAQVAIVPGGNHGLPQALSFSLSSQIMSFIDQQIAARLGAEQDRPSKNSTSLFQDGHSAHGSHTESVVPYSPAVAPEPSDCVWGGRFNKHQKAHAENADDILASVEYDIEEDVWAIPEDHCGRRARSPLRGSFKFEGFLSQAVYNFQTLAHGYANRATMSEKEMNRAAKRRAQRIAEARVAAEQEAERAGLRHRQNRGMAFTADEDKLILRLKSQDLTAKEIARFLPGRSWHSIGVRYSRALKPGSERFQRGRVEELPDTCDENLDPELREDLETASDANINTGEAVTCGKRARTAQHEGETQTERPEAKKPRRPTRKLGFVNLSAAAFQAQHEDSTEVNVTPLPQANTNEVLQPGESSFRVNSFVFVNQDPTTTPMSGSIPTSTNIPPPAAHQTSNADSRPGHAPNPFIYFQSRSANAPSLPMSNWTSVRAGPVTPPSSRRQYKRSAAAMSQRGAEAAEGSQYTVSTAAPSAAPVVTASTRDVLRTPLQPESHKKATPTKSGGPAQDTPSRSQVKRRADKPRPEDHAELDDSLRASAYPSPRQGSDYSMTSGAYCYPIDPSLANSHARSDAPAAELISVPVASPAARRSGLPAWGRVKIHSDMSRSPLPDPGRGMHYQPLKSLKTSENGQSRGTSVSSPQHVHHGPHRTVGSSPLVPMQRQGNVSDLAPVRQPPTRRKQASSAGTRGTSAGSVTSVEMGTRSTSFDIEVSDDDL